MPIDEHQTLTTLGLHGWRRGVAGGVSNTPRSNLMLDCRSCRGCTCRTWFCLDETGVKAPVGNICTIASEICPMPPRRAASRASSAVEISTPMPPTMIARTLFPELQAKVIYTFMQNPWALRHPWRPSWRRPKQAQGKQIIAGRNGLCWPEFYPAHISNLAVGQFPCAA